MEVLNVKTFVKLLMSLYSLDKRTFNVSLKDFDTSYIYGIIAWDHLSLHPV